MITRIKLIAARARTFLRAKRGNVAIIFALAAVPIAIAAGAGLDFARGMLVRQQMSEALDAAALAVGSTTGLDSASAQALAQKFFNANYTVDQTAFGTPTIAPLTYNANGSVTITATSAMPTILMKVAGFATIPITAASTVVWGQSKLWVALVLDNSGSMSQGDSGGSKMQALQNASNQLLTILQNASSTAGDVQVSIVPFVKNVNVGTANKSASWVDFASDWAKPPLTNASTDTHQADTDTLLNGDALNTFGPGDSCPYDGTAGYKCAPTNVNDTNCYTGSGSDDCIGTIPSSGSYKGYICPSMHIGGTQDGMGYHFYNGCWTGATSSSTTTISSGSSATCSGHSATNCSCTGSGSSKKCKTKVWNHTWVANSTNTWTGCLMDREMNPPATTDYDESVTTPSSGYTLFPAENNQYCGTATVTPLGYNWTTLSSQVNAMTAYGATNQAIGVEHGWQTITPGLPYGAPTVPANTARYIILLSDGLNTLDRWYGNGSTENTSADANIDAREEATCDAAKANGIVIYTILLDIPQGSESSSAPLQYCATDSSKYYDLTSTGTIVTTFNQIAEQITNVRVSH